MLLAAIGDTGYNILLILHILTMMGGLAPAFVNPILAAQTKGKDDAAWRSVLGYAAGNSMKIYGSALIVGGLLGFGIAGLSDEVYKMSQGWLATAAVLWVAMNGVLHAMIIPAEKAIAGGDDSAQRKLDIGGAAITVMMIVTLYLMVFKPGL